MPSGEFLVRSVEDAGLTKTICGLYPPAPRRPVSSGVGLPRARAVRGPRGPAADAPRCRFLRAAGPTSPIANQVSSPPRPVAEERELRDQRTARSGEPDPS